MSKFIPVVYRVVMSAMRKSKTGERKGYSCAFLSILNRVTFERNLEGRKGANHVEPEGKNIPGRGNSKCGSLRWQRAWRVRGKAKRVGGRR